MTLDPKFLADLPMMTDTVTGKTESIADIFNAFAAEGGALSREREHMARIRLRDEIAMHVLAGMMASNRDLTFEEYSMFAYQLADAMLQERDAT